MRCAAIIALALLVGFTASGCTLFGGGDSQPRPAWVESHTTGRFDSGKYLVGKGTAPMSGDPVADTRAVRDSAKADMLGQLITEVAGEFRQQVGEYKLGDKWSTTNESMSSVRTTVHGVVDVTFEEEFYRDESNRTVHVLLAVERSRYGASLRHRLQTMLDDQSARIAAINARLAENNPVHALRGIGLLQATVPGWIAASASLASVAGQSARPSAIVTPEVLARLNDEVRQRISVEVSVKKEGGTGGEKLDVAAMRADAEAAFQALRIRTTRGSDATHKLVLTVTPNATQVDMRESGVRFAVASIGWHMSFSAVNQRDYGFTKSNKSDSNRVSKAGTNMDQALAESRGKAAKEIQTAIGLEMLPIQE